MAKIGIIGGSGLYSLLKDGRSVDVKTPHGLPSEKPEIGKINGVEVAFIPRHGRKHQYPPHKVNYKANIEAFVSLGVERVLTLNAVGSLKEDLKPGEIVFPDQFIDFTRRRDLTFYDGPEVYHISAADPFCEDMNRIAYSAAGKLGFKSHNSGTYVCVEGPRFSTRAESRMFRTYADIIGMTLVPEINLSLEKGLCYSTIATITDYDVWAETPVDASEVMRIMKENEEKVSRLVYEILPDIARERKCSCKNRLENAKA
ncbi:MAG: S-methyl-5'-thioadenosine phosphorylase [Candidatus Thermoplasmatota archaeon]|jgi:5'-methylthioadenosine phosphorylase|nr:S-methyl-5'-thioadenosine phosphorylase [Candidatus Thermoplasmatota archaeon]MCL5794541.1 S-methyl-5'-thioadenosine phosphorylase [Candidatus Thermoplasmatota archaeon]